MSAQYNYISTYIRCTVFLSILVSQHTDLLGMEIDSDTNTDQHTRELSFAAMGIRNITHETDQQVFEQSCTDIKLKLLYQISEIKYEIEQFDRRKAELEKKYSEIETYKTNIENCKAKLNSTDTSVDDSHRKKLHEFVNKKTRDIEQNKKYIENEKIKIKEFETKLQHISFEKIKPYEWLRNNKKAKNLLNGNLALCIEKFGQPEFEHFYSSKKNCLQLNLSNLGLKELDDLNTIDFPDSSKDPVVIDLSGNKLSQIKKNDFDCCPQLWKLSFSENNIDYVDPDTFKAHSVLTYVNLSENPIEKNEESLQTLKKSYPKASFFGSSGPL